MSPEELLDLAKRQVDQGLERLVLTMPKPKLRSPYQQRVRTPFGMCEWYPTAQEDRILIFVNVQQVIRYVAKTVKKTLQASEKKE